jgi:hypothetical protein
LQYSEGKFAADYVEMDSRHWQRKGWFRPGLRFDCQWLSDGKVVASLMCAPNSGEWSLHTSNAASMELG